MVEMPGLVALPTKFKGSTCSRCTLRIFHRITESYVGRTSKHHIVFLSFLRHDQLCLCHCVQILHNLLLSSIDKEPPQAVSALTTMENFPKAQSKSLPSPFRQQFFCVKRLYFFLQNLKTYSSKICLSFFLLTFFFFFLFFSRQI